jgi:hypothetical protein
MNKDWRNRSQNTRVQVWRTNEWGQEGGGGENETKNRRTRRRTRKWRESDHDKRDGNLEGQRLR